MMTQIIIKFKRLLNEKGQGIVEFGLLCAFCAAISIAARDMGFADAFRDSLDKSRPELLSAAIAQNTEGTYLYYFEEKGWKNLTPTELSAIEDKERIKADQLLLIKLAETYLGKTETGVLNLMNYYSNSWKDLEEPAFIANIPCSDQQTGTGFSGVLVPLEFKENQLDVPGKDWLAFEYNNNQNTVDYLTGGKATLYDKHDPNNPTFNYTSAQGGRRTVTTDRMFYSKSLLNEHGRVTVSVKLHYTDGKVDKVAISARKGTWDAKAEQIGKDLCLLVTESGNQVVQQVKGHKDILREEDLSVYANVWNVPDLQ